MACTAQNASSLLKVQGISTVGIDHTVALWLRSVNGRHDSARAVLGPHITRIAGCPC
jgi:hypothetical protein